MFGAIANPKKTIAVDFSLEKVKVGIERINKISNNKYKVTKSNPTFNQTTLEATEFLSLGVFIDVNLSAVNESKTEITIEIRRKVGAFDQAHEVTKANQHIESLFETIAKGINMSELDLSNLNDSQEKAKKKETSILAIVLWSVIILIFSFLAFAFYKMPK